MGNLSIQRPPILHTDTPTGPPALSSYPFVFIHPFKGVLREGVLTVAQLGHHRAQQLQVELQGGWHLYLDGHQGAYPLLATPSQGFF